MSIRIYFLISNSYYTQQHRHLISTFTHKEPSELWILCTMYSPKIAVLIILKVKLHQMPWNHTPCREDYTQELLTYLQSKLRLRIPYDQNRDPQKVPKGQNIQRIISCKLIENDLWLLFLNLLCSSTFVKLLLNYTLFLFQHLDCNSNRVVCRISKWK